MFSTRRRLFRLFGIPIYVDLSWLVIVVLMTGTLIGLFRDKAPGLSTWQYALMSLSTALLFFTCLVLHELGHALTARAAGIPIRGITLFLFGGVAELEDEPRSAGSEFLMAIAGPAVSAVLCVLLLGTAALGMIAEWPRAVTSIFEYLGWINLTVLIFNMVPAFPLDGGRVLRSLLWGLMGNLRRATWWAALSGRAFAWVLIGMGVLNLFSGQILAGFWLAVIGLFLSNAAQGGYQQVVLRQAFEGESVRRFMNPNPIVVSPSLDLQEWVEEYVYRYHRKAFPVGEGGRLEGYVTTQALSRIPRDEWAEHRLSEIMEHDLGPVSIAPDADAMHALTQMQRTGLSRLLVVEEDRLLGILSLKDLLRFLHLKEELEGEEGSTSDSTKRHSGSPRGSRMVDEKEVLVP